MALAREETMGLKESQRLMAVVIVAVALVVLLAVGSHIAAAADSPRQRLLLDFGWRFQNGDPSADVAKSLEYPEPKDLAKTRKPDVVDEPKLAAARVDPVATHL